MLTLGAMEKAGTELVLPGTCHFLLRKSDIPNYR
jgi:hypothetical protein